jgi:hypothetical protein
MRNPFIRLRESILRHRTDEEWVTFVRTYVSFIERRRPWMLVLITALGVLYIQQALYEALPALSRIPVAGVTNWQLRHTFVAGATVGALLTFPLILLVIGAIVMVVPLRTERLLLKYHDALRQSSPNPEMPADVV